MVVAGEHVLQYAITDLSGESSVFRLDQPATREARLRAHVLRWAVDGVDIVQLREKQLESGELYTMARSALVELRAFAQGSERRPPALLINGRPDIAAAARADGVHLTGSPGELTPTQVRGVFRAAGCPGCVISVSCHSMAEVELAREHGVDLILFGPVFGKHLAAGGVLPGVGLDGLAMACAAARDTPVLALGGITERNRDSCVQRGAAGIAAIRLFRQA